MVILIVSICILFKRYLTKPVENGLRRTRDLPLIDNSNLNSSNVRREALRRSLEISHVALDQTSCREDVGVTSITELEMPIFPYEGDVPALKWNPSFLYIKSDQETESATILYEFFPIESLYELLPVKNLCEIVFGYLDLLSLIKLALLNGKSINDVYKNSSIKRFEIDEETEKEILLLFNQYRADSKKLNHIFELINQLSTRPAIFYNQIRGCKEIATNFMRNMLVHAKSLNIPPSFDKTTLELIKVRKTLPDIIDGNCKELSLALIALSQIKKPIRL